MRNDATATGEAEEVRVPRSKVPAGFDEPSFSVGEFADAIGVHRVTVRRWINSGLLTHWLTPTGRARIPQSAVDAGVKVRAAHTEETAA